jgi:hypothetical protein
MKVNNNMLTAYAEAFDKANGRTTARREKGLQAALDAGPNPLIDQLTVAARAQEHIIVQLEDRIKLLEEDRARLERENRDLINMIPPVACLEDVT